MAAPRNNEPVPTFSAAEEDSRSCIVVGCEARFSSLIARTKGGEGSPDLVKFPLPDYVPLRKQWLEILGRLDLEYVDLYTNNHEEPLLQPTYYVCARHFHPSSMVTSPESPHNMWLRHNTLPTKNLPNIKKKLTVRVRGSIKKKDERVTSFIPISEQMELQKKNEKKKNDPEETFLDICQKYLFKDINSIIQIRNRIEREGYTTENIDFTRFCYRLHYASPKTYRLLAPVLNLPPIRDVAKSHVPTSTRLGGDVLDGLRIKVESMSEEEKNCCVVVDAVNLSAHLYYDITHDRVIGFREVDGEQAPAPACLALVALVRGIRLDWMQPIGYALLSDRKPTSAISSWVDKILITLIEIGLRVRVFVSNVISNSQYVSLIKPHFYLRSQRIYYMHDVPHLLMILYNIFQKNDIQFEPGRTAKFEHVKQFYEQDRMKTNRLAPKLTDRHIYTTNIERMKLCYATQVFSYTVAVGISTYVDFKAIEDGGRRTAQFIKNINDLFDAMNSSTRQPSYEPKRAYCGTEDQNEFFEKMLRMFRNMERMNPELLRMNGVFRPLNVAFRLSINCVTDLFRDLEQEGCQYLLTRRLSTEAAHAITNKIRSKSDKDCDPTSKQFTTAFRKIYFEQLLKPLKQDPKEKLSKLFSDFLDCPPPLTPLTPGDDDGSCYDLLEIVRADYAHFKIPSGNAIMHISKFLIFKCLQRHSCDLLHFVVQEHKLREVTDLVPFIVVNSKVYATVGEMEAIFRRTLKQSPLPIPTGAHLLKQLDGVECKMPCACFPKRYMKKLFIRMRIFYTMTINNKKLYKPYSNINYYCSEIIIKDLFKQNLVKYKMATQRK